MPDFIVLTHGAGSNRDAPLLVAVDQAFQAAGFGVSRMNLPFRDARPSGSPHAGDAAKDREGLRQAVLRAREKGGRVFLGGHSYGGRQSSMLAAEKPGLVDGLLLMSYPLHPPGRKDQPRTAHLPDVQTPALFIHGSRDPFGSIEEMNVALALIPARHGLIEIKGSGHELAPRRASGIADTAARIVDEFRRFYAMSREAI